MQTHQASNTFQLISSWDRCCNFILFVETLDSTLLGCEILDKQYLIQGHYQVWSLMTFHSKTIYTQWMSSSNALETQSHLFLKAKRIYHFDFPALCQFIYLKVAQSLFLVNSYILAFLWLPLISKRSTGKEKYD